jgi:methionine aminopeptidase
MVELKTAAEVVSMAAAGAVVAERLRRVSEQVRTASGARAAHCEHTVAVTTDGHRVLTG